MRSAAGRIILKIIELVGIKNISLFIIISGFIEFKDIIISEQFRQFVKKMLTQVA